MKMLLCPGIPAIVLQGCAATGFARTERDVWEYRRYVDPFDDRHIAVQFSSDGVVREVLMLKDYNREVCGS